MNDLEKARDAERKARKQMPVGGVPAEGPALEKWQELLRDQGRN